MSTKKLAKELGIIRKRSQNKESGQTKRPGKKQYFSYLIIIDFESTCWREKNNYGQEIIEFPAVLLNTSTGAVESEFHTYVQPQEHPFLSEFCTELTGITQTQVEAGVPLSICLSRFTRWLHSLQQDRGVLFVRDGKAPLVPGCPCAFVTWSDWDLGVCLLYECKRKQICKPEVLNSWIDLRATYKLFYNRKPKGLNGALQDLGIEFSGREHSGLDDARNTARLAWRMMTDGCFMKITKSLDRTPLRAKPLFPNKPVNNDSSNHHEHSSQTNMQEGVCKQQQHRSESTTLECSAKPPSSDVTLDTTHRLNVNQNPGTYQCQSLVTPKTVLGSLSSCLSVGGMTGPMMRQQGALSRSSLSFQATGLVLVSTTVSSHTDVLAKQLNFDLEASEVDWTDGVVLPETEEPGPSYDDVVLEEEEQNLGDGCDPEVATNSGVCRKGPGKTLSSLASSPLCLPRASLDSLMASGGGLKETSANRTSLPVVKNRPQVTTSADACFKMPQPVSAPTGDNYRSVLRPFVHKTTTPRGSVAHSFIHKPTTPSVSATNSNPHYTTLGSLVSNHSLNSATPCSSTPKYIARKTTALSSGSALPSPLYQSNTPCCGHTVQRNSSKTTTPSTPFTIFQDVESQPSTSTRIQASTGGSFSVPPSVLSSSVNQSSLPASSRAGAPRKAAMTTVTSPLCGCGRRAKRLSVGNGGPNHGRGFYCCPVRRSGPGVSAPKKGCEFFKWETALLASLTPGLSKQRHASCPTRPAPALPKLLR
ncbi:ERI1 exoribonuclease 2 [Alosa pseudoharengus]|uniref:ERI1 exoribonuclease 2 n=1 Tax=Alosa pseudoharengus TaxID=34774 RepID=UPI003F8B74F8